MSARLMNAVVISAPLQASVQQIERWSHAPNEVLVRCKFAAVCTTERRIFSGLREVYPVIGGHELSGVVESVGGDECALAPGDHVVIDAVRRCGHCYYCLRGHSNHCAEMRKRKPRAGYVLIGGGFAQFTIAPATRAVKLPDNVELDQACLIEPLACCVRSIKKAHLAFGDTLVIIGAGTMGLMHVMLAKLLGARIIVINIDEARLNIAAQLGAQQIINARSGDPIKAVKDLTEGRGAEAVIVTSGDKVAGEQGVAMAGRLGFVIFYSSIYPATMLNLDWNRIHYEEIVVTGTEGKTEADFREAVRLLEVGLADLRPLISSFINLKELPSELGAEHKGAIFRVVVRH